MRYRIESRHQDEDWEPTGTAYDSLHRAVYRAGGMAEDASVWGMVRVVDTVTGEVVAKFPVGAGAEGECDPPEPSGGWLSRVKRAMGLGD